MAADSTTTVLVIGDHFKDSLGKLTKELVTARKGAVAIEFCPDKAFALSNIHLYADYPIIVVNWDKYAVLMALFLRKFPGFRAKLVLLSGIYLTNPHGPSADDIDKYEIFDYFISSINAQWTRDTWFQVFDELDTVAPKRKPITAESAIGYFLYRWSDYEFGGRLSHVNIVVRSSGKRHWSQVPTAYQMAFERFPKEFCREVMTMGGEMYARPIWGVPTVAPGGRSKCFVLMPFKDPFNEIYQDHIKPTIESLGVSCLRADDLYTTNPVMTDVWNGINNCLFLIAELTGRNSNVMYELGIAHAVGKEVILICQDASDVPFDFRHMRYYRYDHTPRGCTKLMESLSKAVSEIRRNPWD